VIVDSIGTITDEDESAFIPADLDQVFRTNARYRTLWAKASATGENQTFALLACMEAADQIPSLLYELRILRARLARREAS